MSNCEKKATITTAIIIIIFFLLSLVSWASNHGTFKKDFHSLCLVCLKTETHIKGVRRGQTTARYRPRETLEIETLAVRQTVTHLSHIWATTSVSLFAPTAIRRSLGVTRLAQGERAICETARSITLTQTPALHHYNFMIQNKNLL